MSGLFLFRKVVVPLASSRDTRNGPDLRDVTAVMMAFEAINQVELVIHLTVEQISMRNYLVMEAQAFDKLKPKAEARLLASANAKVGSSDPRTMDAAIMQLMYKLDGQLAAGEFSKLTR